MRIAVITGASSGMGKEFVRQAVLNDVFDEIWAIARNKERLAALQELVPNCRIPIDGKRTLKNGKIHRDPRKYL